MSIFSVLLLSLGVSLGSLLGADRLWYRQPAKDWNEALPVGNGRLGAMVFGGPTSEIIQLNEESLWAGCPIDNNNPKAREYLPEIRRFLFTGEYEKAGELAEKTMLGKPPRIRSYQPLGDLRLDFGGEGKQASASAEFDGLKSYERDLRLREGIAAVVFEDAAGRKMTRKVFVSAVDDVLVVRIVGGPEARIDVRVRLSREKDASPAAGWSRRPLIPRKTPTSTPRPGNRFY